MASRRAKQKFKRSHQKDVSLTSTIVLFPYLAMTPMQQDVRVQCEQFINSLERPAFIVIAWKKNEDEVDIVQCVNQMDPDEYFKGMTWAMHEVMDEL